MTKIIDNLYIASVEETYKDSCLKSSVTHILNVAGEIMINYRVDHIYKKLGINDDDKDDDIRAILPECIEWMNTAISQGGSVCVHCLEGKSRSVCVCIAFLCCKRGWSFDDAYELVRARRPWINVYPLYLEQLKSYLSQLL